MEKNKKKVTISMYLKDINDKFLKIYLENYNIKNVDIELFFKMFDSVQHNPKDVAKFILDEANGVELSIFGHRVNGSLDFPGYNGKSDYQGTKSTIGSRYYHG